MNPDHQPSLFQEPSRRFEAWPNRLGHADVEYVEVRDILTRATGFMDAYDFTLNPYSGCSYGCTYCYAAFFSHSTEKRDSWGRWVDVKKNAVERLGRRRGSLDGKLIYMSSVTDPYQPIERRIGLTRGLLEILVRQRPKLVVQTRSPDVVRDIDLFAEIVERGGRVQVNMTVTTDDEDIRRTFEPFCPSNAARLRASRELCESGVETCVTMTPLLLVRSAGKFADELCATGIRDFIVQPFHFQRGQVPGGYKGRSAALNGGEAGQRLGDLPGRLHRALSRRAAGLEAAIAEARGGQGRIQAAVLNAGVTWGRGGRRALAIRAPAAPGGDAGEWRRGCDKSGDALLQHRGSGSGGGPLVHPAAHEGRSRRSAGSRGDAEVLRAARAETDGQGRPRCSPCATS